MARSTPTYTPAGKYVLGGIISTALLIADLNYQTFSAARGLTQASGIYTQLILGKDLFIKGVDKQLIGVKKNDKIEIVHFIGGG